MRLVKIIGIALVTVCALSAMAAAGASAHSFETNAKKLLVLASAEGPQVFVTLAGVLTCNTLKGHGITPEALVSLTQDITVQYTGCAAAVNGGITAKPTEPIVVLYLFNADETVTIDGHVTISATLGGLKCTILVLPQTLSGIVYKNVSGKILVASNVSGIETNGTGAGCLDGGSYTSSKTGTYVGNAITEVDGGTVTWS